MTGELATSPNRASGDRGLRRVMLSIMPVTASVQILSFLSSVVMTSALGATRDTDAYYLALLIPSISSGVLLAGLRQGGIPALTEERADSEEAFRRSASSLFLAVIVTSFIAAVLITAIAIVVMQLALGHWSAKYVDRACIYSLMLIPYTVGGAVLGAMAATLAVLGSFRAAIGVSAAEPAVKILLILALPELGGFSLTLGNLGGQAISLALLFIFLMRVGFRFIPRSPIRTKFVKRVLLVSAPLVIGQSVLQVNPLVDRAVASSLDSGSVTALELATRLIVPPTVLLSSAMLTPLVATWAARQDAGGWTAIKESFTSVLELIMVASCVFLAVGLPLSQELVGFIYGNGAFTAEAVSATAGTFQVLLLSLPLGLVFIPCSTIFVVAEHTIFPMKVAFGNVIVNTALSIPLAAALGLPGVALGTTLTYTLLVIVYLVEIQRRFSTIDTRFLLRTLAVCVGAGVIGATAAMLANDGVQAGTQWPSGLVLSASCVAGLVGCGIPLGYYMKRRGLSLRPRPGV